MAKVTCIGLLKSDNPIFSCPVYFATPIMLSDLCKNEEKLDKEEKKEMNNEEENK